MLPGGAWWLPLFKGPIMKRLLLPWSQIHIPGITAEVVEGRIQADDLIVEVPPSAVPELAAAFAAFCASWQQSDRHACRAVQPLLAKYGVIVQPL
jgi:hypothetical protein